MQVLREWVSLVQEDIFVAVLLYTGLATIFLALLLGSVFKSEGLYFSFLITAFSFAVLASVCSGRSWQVCAFCLSLLSAVGGIGYLFLFLFFFIGKRRAKRKQKRTETLRKMQYTLPQNEYVRSRLQTVLEGAEEEKEKRECKLSYARRLLAKVKEAPLTVAEKLEAEELGKALALFVQRDRWTAEDMRRANDLFARILKLSGKYTI